MTHLSDIIQILLNTSGFSLALSVLVVALALMQAWKAAFVSVRTIRTFLLKPSWGNVRSLVALSAVLYIFARPIHDGLQYAEQVYFKPVYPLTQRDTAGGEVEAAYKRELYRQVVEQMDIRGTSFGTSGVETYRYIVEQTNAQAAKYGTSALEIYRVALSECALNPFAFNVKNGRIIAAGWIQFTATGISGLTFRGGPVSFSDVVDACRRRDIRFIMELTDVYFQHNTKGRGMPSAVDVYTVVFAPGLLGRGMDAVTYSGWNNPAYTENSVFDGYSMVGGRVVRMDRWKDGKITIGEMYLHLLLKEQVFLKNQKQV